MSDTAQQIQFIGINPNELIEQLKTSLLAELNQPQPVSNDLDLLTRKEVCTLLKINQSTLYRWTKDNVIPSYGISNRIYFKRSEIEQILNNNKLS